MADLSASPGGSIYIDAPDKIVKAFHKRVQDLGNVCIQDLHLSLRTAGAAILRDAFRVSPHIGRLSFVDERASLGPLQKERPQTFVLELLVAGTSPGKHRLMQIDVDGTVPGFDQRPARSSYTLTMPFDRQPRGASSVPTEITLALRKLAIFKMQERAIADAELGQIEPAASRLKTLATRLLDIGETELAHAALLEAGHLAETGSLSPAGRKKIRFGTRGLGIPSQEVRYD
jgi:Ca-activated chloride channel family protein